MSPSARLGKRLGPAPRDNQKGQSCRKRWISNRHHGAAAHSDPVFAGLQLYASGLFFVTAALFLGIWNDEALYFAHWYIFGSCIFTLMCAALWRALPRRQRKRREENLHVKQSLLSAPWLTFYVSLLTAGLAISGSIGPGMRIGTWIEANANLASRPAINLAFYMSFFAGTGLLLYARRRNQGRSFLVLMAALALASVVALLRIKLLALPLAIAILYPAQGKKFTLRALVVFGAVFVCGYFAVMFARWLGNPEQISLASAGGTLQRVLAAGFERHLVPQFSAVMQHFSETGDFQGGAVYQRYLLYPLDFVFGIDLAPENPMYRYYEIFSGEPNLLRGSAHPSVFGDSFAEFGWWGMMVAGVQMLAVSALGDRRVTSLSAAAIVPAAFTGIAMLVRGSTFYGIYYVLLGGLITLLWWGAAMALHYASRGREPVEVVG